MRARTGEVNPAALLPSWRGFFIKILLLVDHDTLGIQGVDVYTETGIPAFQYDLAGGALGNDGGPFVYVEGGLVAEHFAACIENPHTVGPSGLPMASTVNLASCYCSTSAFSGCLVMTGASYMDKSAQRERIFTALQETMQA